MPTTYTLKDGTIKKYNYYLKKTQRLPSLISDITHKIRRITDREALINIENYIDNIILAYETPTNDEPNNDTPTNN